MATNLKNYIATAQGYYDGKVRKPEDGPFLADFREIAREEPNAGDLKRFEEKGGKRPVGAIKRDKDGNAVRGKLMVPSWAEPIDAKDAAAMDAAAGEFADPVFEEMSREALEAYAATNSIPFTKKMSDDDLVAACHAQTDYRT